MTSANDYQPRPEHKFSFGLWTVGNRGRDAFGDFVRPPISPLEIVSMLAEVGAWGVNLHDNDLVPIDATTAERDCIVRSFKKACETSGIVVPMATVSLYPRRHLADGHEERDEVCFGSQAQRAASRHLHGDYFRDQRRQAGWFRSGFSLGFHWR
jgi:hypothetical protein